MPATGVVLPARRPRAKGLRPFRGSSRIFLFSMTWPREEVSASRSGVLSVTWIVSTTSPGVRVTRTVAFWSTWRVKAARLERLKPLAWTVTEYSPAGRKVAWNSPRSPVEPARVRPVALLVTLMVARGTTAWEPSSATTLMVPVAVWA